MSLTAMYLSTTSSSMLSTLVWLLRLSSLLLVCYIGRLFALMHAKPSSATSRQTSHSSAVSATSQPIPTPMMVAGKANGKASIMPMREQ